MKQKILDITSKNIELYGLKKFTMDDISYDLKISKKPYTSILRVRMI